MPLIPPDQCSPFPRATRARKRPSQPTAALSQDARSYGNADSENDSGNDGEDDERHALPPSRRRPSATRRHDRDDTSAVHQRQGDRGSRDDDSDARRVLLPVYVRFRDLEAAGIVANWTTLLRLIDDEGFPAGVLIGPNTRAWRLDTITEWLEARPTARKDIASNAIHPRVRDKRRADVAQETRS